jgi:predicted anti-sigma-YlaC factor YlaD
VSVDPCSELTCQELVELVTDYLENALSRDDRLRFEEHLGICPGCATYLDQMRLTIQTVGHIREESLDPLLCDQLLDLFRNWKHGKS